MKKIKYIQRVTGAWRLKIKQGNDYKYTKHFNFEKCGGVKKALLAAKERRDEILRERNMLEYLKFERAPNSLRYNIVNEQPVIGVYKTKQYRSDSKFMNWTARLNDRESPSKRSFSIKKYGNELSFIYACMVRYEKCGTLIVINKNILPCLPTVPYRIEGKK